MQIADSLGKHEAACIEACQAVVRATEHCVDACSREDGMGECVRRCRDAADVASLLAQLVARESPHAPGLAGVCEDVCTAAADECEQHDDEHCRAAVEPLRECADHCGKLAS